MMLSLSKSSSICQRVQRSLVTLSSQPQRHASQHLTLPRPVGWDGLPCQARLSTHSLSTTRSSVPFARIAVGESQRIVTVRRFHESATLRQAQSAAARRKRKKTSKSAAATPATSSTTTTATNSTNKASPAKKKKGSSKRKKKKPAKQLTDWDKGIKSELTGRLMFTKDLMAKDSRLVQLAVHEQNVRNLVHNTGQKLNFEDFGMTHDIMGPVHDQMFVVHTRATIDARLLDDVSKPAVMPPGVTRTTYTMQVQSCGLARGKREAEIMSLLDLVLLLYEAGINVRDPPNLRKILKEAEKEQFRADLKEATVLLEACRVTRPRFMVETLNHKSYADVDMMVNSRLIRASGEGDSKAEAQGRALIAASVSASLSKAVGRDRLEELQRIIADSPAQHASVIYVPPLPEESLEEITDAIGDDQEERLQQHIDDKARFEQFLREKQSSNHHAPKRHHISDRDKEAINASFLEHEKSREEKAFAKPEGTHGKMKAIRDALPIKAIQKEMLEYLQERSVVVVSGGTGSGKSTQCPQYILEDSIAQGKGADTRVLVTQPRRIAAISVAERVAAERGERIGNSVGYTVRFNREPPRQTGGSIEFVTTGVLLRRLVNDPMLDGVSHVMIDEVHERDIDTDFLLVLLKELMHRRPDLRIILMSATLNADSFAAYFSRDEDDSTMTNDRVPVLSVPTQPRYPVEVFHLEDLAGEEGQDDEDERVESTVPSDLQRLAASLLSIQDQQLQLELEEAEEEEKAALQFQVRPSSENQDDLLMNYDSENSDSDSEGEEDSSRTDSFTASRAQARAEKLRAAMSMRNPGSEPSRLKARKKAGELKREMGEVNVTMVAKIAQHVAEIETDAGRNGSILCFLPGWDEIKMANEILGEAPRSLTRRMKILLLHSTVPKEDQHKVFEPAEEGIVKVILATNIAESSVTINDVLAVVDSGLVRELQYDAERAMSTMETVPTSRASATQRLGRAGRVAPGTCYRIYSRGALHAMLERPVPEIQRTALESTCLQTCSMRSDGVANFLRRALDPPSDESVSLAMDRLVKLGAISSTEGTETLTPLGRSLSRLPLDPGIGRMLIMGCVMNCLDPVLTAAACYSSRSPFYTPPGLRDEANDARKSFSESSDLMSTVAAYNKFRSLVADDGWDAVHEWANENFVSVYAMKSIHSVRAQLLNDLNRIGYVPNRDVTMARNGKKYLREDAIVNQNGNIDRLASAVWASGLPSNIAVRRSRLSHFGTFRTSHEENASLHPSSVAFHRKPPNTREALPKCFLYQEMVLSSQVFLRGCTAITPHQILLFGGNSVEKQSNGGVVIDDWMVTDGPCTTTLDVLSSARRELNMAIEQKAMRPKRPLPETYQAILDAVSCVFEDADNDEEE